MGESVRRRDDFDIVPIQDLYESPLNPRKIYSEKAMAELIESIRTKGILTPLLVRPNNGRFEIGAGHRRYRAAVQLGVTELPVLVREMSDTDFLELITIENLQREDIHPLDEAQGYRTLIEKNGLEVQAVAGKVGKSISYVYQRLKLTELISEVQKAFSEEKITAGHAILIARLQPNDQKTVLEQCRERSDLYREAMSVRDLAEYIESEIHLDLNSASFSKKDPNLVSEAGPCTTCPKRTGFQPELFADIKKKDTCTDRVCFHRKVEAHTVLWLKKKSEDSDVPPLKLSGDYDYRKKKLPENPEEPVLANFYHEIQDRKKDSCQHAREGIVTEGRNQGKVLIVCMEPSCKVHHRSGYSDSAEGQKYRAQQKAETEKKKQKQLVRIQIVDAVLAKIPKELSKDDLIFLAGEFLDELWDEYRRQFAKRHSIEPIKEQYTHDYLKPADKYFKTLDRAALQKILMEMALIRNQEHRQYNRKGDALILTAERYHIDPKAIEADFRKESQERKASKKSKSQTSAKKTKHARP
jgi:ParB family chromosome partitioning protein